METIHIISGSRKTGRGKINAICKALLHKYHSLLTPTYILITHQTPLLFKT